MIKKSLQSAIVVFDYGMLQNLLISKIDSLFRGYLPSGGYFHGRNHLTYGVDVDHIRWLGVLQVMM